MERRDSNPSTESMSKVFSLNALFWIFVRLPTAYYRQLICHFPLADWLLKWIWRWNNIGRRSRENFRDCEKIDKSDKSFQPLARKLPENIRLSCLESKKTAVRPFQYQSCCIYSLSLVKSFDHFSPVRFHNPESFPETTLCNIVRLRNTITNVTIIRNCLFGAVRAMDDRGSNATLFPWLKDEKKRYYSRITWRERIGLYGAGWDCN